MAEAHLSSAPAVSPTGSVAATRGFAQASPTAAPASIRTARTMFPLPKRPASPTAPPVFMKHTPTNEAADSVAASGVPQGWRGWPLALPMVGLAVTGAILRLWQRMTAAQPTDQLMAMATVAGDRLSAAAPAQSANTVTVTPGDHVLRLAIDPDHFRGFHDSWHDSFPEGSSIYHYSALDRMGEKATIDAVDSSFVHTLRWLPPEVTKQVLRMPFDDEGPAAILISGLPLDLDVPPKPRVDTLHRVGDAWDEARVPLAESLLFGISRALGIPYAPAQTNPIGRGLVRDMAPVPNVPTSCSADLRMHSDYPRAGFPQYEEPEFLVLVAVRGDRTHQARTQIVDSQRLMDAMDPGDRRLLRSCKIQAALPGQGPLGAAFHPISTDSATGTVRGCRSAGQTLGRSRRPTHS